MTNYTFVNTDALESTFGQMIYWAVEINGWDNHELVFGKGMTSTQAIATVIGKGIVRESLQAPVEITESQYLKEIKYRNS